MTSKERRSHFIEAISWSISILALLFSVGLSRGMFSISGSRYPRTTSLAFALRVFPWSFCSWGSVIGFHVQIQRQRSICSGDSLSLNTRLTVPVCNQLFTSLTLAISNSSRSSSVRVLSLTSLRFFLLPLVSHTSASGHSWISSASHRFTSYYIFQATWAPLVLGCTVGSSSTHSR